MFENDDDLYIGTSSWSSKDWAGVFYPKGLKPAEFIEHYSTVFDTVEIDASFYRSPTRANVDSWERRTPPGFQFSAKVPRVITHDKMLVDAEDDMQAFLEVISGLGPKLGPLLLQFPYFNKQKFASAGPFLERLDAFLRGLPREFRYTVEIRNKQWLGQPLHDLLTDHNAALAWIEQAWMPEAARWPQLSGGPTTDFAYIRFLGDHKKIEEMTTSWSKIVWDRSQEISGWAPVLSELRRQQIRTFGYFNNHFAGYAPGTIELFREYWRRTQESS